MTAPNDRRAAGTERWVIHADLDAFFAAAEVLRRPELAGQPVLVGGSPLGRGVVSSATYEARAAGVCSAMPMAQAVRLCPEAIVVRPDFTWYRELSERFRVILESFSPLVEVVSIDEAYLDASGSDRLFGGPVDLAIALKRRVRDELGLAVSLGVASNKLVAKIASDLDKPDGLRVVPQGSEAQTLAPLPVERLPGIGPKASARLRAQGIATLGELAEAPDALLRAAGSDPARLRLRAHGVDDRPVTTERDPRKSIGHEHTFSRDLLGFGELEGLLYDLCESTGAELRRRALTATTVTLKLRYNDFTTITRQHPLARPSDAHQELFGVARDLLRQALTERQAPVRLLGVRVSGLTPAVRQLELFDDSRTRTRRLNDAIDALAGTGVIRPARFALTAPSRNPRGRGRATRHAFPNPDERR
jgi:DNA polymerase-4